MNLVIVFSFVVALVAYGLSAGVAYYRRLSASERYDTQAAIMALIGLIAHAVCIGATSMVNGGTALHGASILMLVSWFLGLGSVVLSFWQQGKPFARYVVLITLLTMLISWGMGAGLPVDQKNEVYRSWPVLVIHVACFLIAAVAFVVAGVNSALLLVAQSRLKSSDPIAMTEKNATSIPPLSSLKRVARRAVIIGFPFYTLGLVLGIFRAIGMFDYWFLSPRVLASFALWLVILLFLFQVYIAKSPSVQIARAGIAIAVLTLLLAILSSTLPMFL